MKTAVHKWLKDGADLKAGHRLFLSLFPRNRAFAILLEHDLERYRQQLFAALTSGEDLPSDLVESQRRFYTPIPKRSRERFAFLNSPDCPKEYKILVHDRISAYHRYCSAHKRLSLCTSLEECYNTARTVIEAFRENRLIFRELEYFNRYSTPLGIHPIFKREKQVRELGKLPIRELLDKERRLLHNIWRIESQIGRGDRPDLKQSREIRLKERKILLFEVQKILSFYDTSKNNGEV